MIEDAKNVAQGNKLGQCCVHHDKGMGMVVLVIVSQGLVRKGKVITALFKSVEAKPTGKAVCRK